MSDWLDEDHGPNLSPSEEQRFVHEARLTLQQRDRANVEEGQELLGAYSDDEATTPADALRAFVRSLLR